MKKIPANRNTRILKIYPKFYQRSNNTHVNLPYIRLSGRWLEHNDFKIGAYVQIVCESERIIITKVKTVRKR